MTLYLVAGFVVLSALWTALTIPAVIGLAVYSMVHPCSKSR
jgi:hypothetical protein